MFSHFPFSTLQALFSHLSSLFTKPPLLKPSGDDTHHKLIAIILILEHACLSYASQSKPIRDEALDMAYSRYCASGVHNEVVKQFVAPLEEYSILQFTEFVLQHRL